MYRWSYRSTSSNWGLTRSGCLAPSSTTYFHDVDGTSFPVPTSYSGLERKATDPEENDATGAWWGSASDLEPIQQRGRMKETNGALEDPATG